MSGRIAIIPARGGSKRIPRKNIRPFAGKPILAYSVECALASGLFDRILVSTDDPEIATLARSIGADVPFLRPPALADDHTGTTAVMAHALEWLADQPGAPVTAACCIYATAPFIRSDDLRAALALLEGGDWDYAFSATRSRTPVYRAFRRTSGAGLEMLFPEYYDTRSQDLPEALYDAAQFYWGRPAAWLEGRTLFGERSTVWLLPGVLVQDIDTEEDWRRAEERALGRMPP
jgi:N-acylneuraminate cytidylyltransferase